MPKANTTVKSVRIDNDTLAALEGLLDGQSINSWLNEKIEEAVGLPSKRKPSNTGLPDGYKEKYEDLLSRYDKLANEMEALRGKPEVNPAEDLSEWREALEDIETMAELSGGTVESLIDALGRAMNDGDILFDGEELVFTLPEWAEKIRDACHDRCVTEDVFGKKIVDMINRGQI